MTKENVKQITGVIVSYAVGATVGILIKSNTPEDVKTFQKVVTSIGSIAISSWLGKTVGEHTNEMIDEMIYNEVKTI